MPMELLEGPRVVWSIGGFPITESIVAAWIVMATILLAAFAVTRTLREVPSKVQTVVELLVGTIEDLVDTSMGENGKRLMPYIGALAIYLFVANVSSLFGLRSPTADVNVTASLALLTFFLTHYLGLKSKGLKYIKGFFEPFFLFAPLNVIGELARPVSLALRLYGNLLGGAIIVGLVSNAVPYILPVPVHAYFDLFSSLIQTFIFIMLSMTFISSAME